MIPSIQSAKAFFIPLIEALLNDGNNVTLFTSAEYENKHFQWQNDFPEKLILHDYPIPRVPLPQKLVEARKRLFSICTEERTQIHGHFLIGSLIVAGLPRKSTLFKLCFLHGLVEKDFSFFKRQIIKYLEHYIAQKSDLLWVFNERDKERLKRYNTVRLMPGYGMGIDTSRFTHHENYKKKSSVIRSELGISDNTLVFVFTGRFIKTKGIDNIIKGFKNFKKTFPNSALLLIGEPDPAHKITLNDKDPEILNLGWQSDLAKFFAISDIYVTASHREAMAVGVMEALYCGLPILAPPTKGIKELIASRKDCYIMPGRTATDIEKGMHYFSENLSEIKSSQDRFIYNQIYSRAHAVSIQNNLFKEIKFK